VSRSGCESRSRTTSSCLVCPSSFAQDRARIWTRAGKACSAKRILTNLPPRALPHNALAMQWSVRINEAYQRLERSAASALPTCANWAVRRCNADSNTAMPAAFLMQQMAWREALDDAADLSLLWQQLADVVASQSSLGCCNNVRRCWTGKVTARPPLRRFAPSCSSKSFASDLNRDVCDQLATIAHRWRFYKFPSPANRPIRIERRIAVGIDLGTTHSLVAAVRNGSGRVLARCAGPGGLAERGALPGWAAPKHRPRRVSRTRLTTLATPSVSVKRLMGRASA